MKKRYVLFLLVFLISLIAVSGHGGVDDGDGVDKKSPWATWDVVGYVCSDKRPT